MVDPSGLSEGAWVVQGRSPNAITLAGSFSEELNGRGPIAGLGRESGRLARGVGPTYYQTDGIAGSSGCFGVGYTLLEAVIGGAGKLALLDPSGAPVFETEANGWVRIPLYREPATLLPAGRYSVAATVKGTTVTLPLEIQ